MKLRITLVIVIALAAAAPATAQTVVRPDSALDAALELAEELPACVHVAGIVGDTLFVTGGGCDDVSIGTIRRAAPSLCTSAKVDHVTYLFSTEVVRITVCGPAEVIFQARPWLLQKPAAAPDRVTAGRTPQSSGGTS